MTRRITILRDRPEPVPYVSRVTSRTRRMALTTPRSLRHEYTLFVDQEIERYKDSVPRSVLLGIGDEAVSALHAQEQVALTELLLWDEVDRIISRRLRLPTFEQWKRRRLRLIAKYRNPAHWGLALDAPIVSAIPTSPDTRVLVAGVASAPLVEGAALYLAANGCEVTTVEPEEDVVERVIHAATEAGMSERVRGMIAGLADWAPSAQLHAVLCTPAAFEGLSAAERARVIATLQSATADGGVHLVQTLVAGQAANATDSLVSFDELCARYLGWDVSLQPDTGNGRVFLARKLHIA